MKYIVMLFIGALFLPACTFAAVKINEVAWMGTAASQYSEWIELYNDGEQDVSLDGWKLYKTGDTVLFTLSKTISAKGYLLVERITNSAPDAIPGIADEAGTFGGSGLRNGGEDLTLKDESGNAINIVPFASGWPAGDAKTKDTMQWTGSKWITAPSTPDAVNASEEVPIEKTQTPSVATPQVSITVPAILNQPITVPPSPQVISTVQSPVVAAVTIPSISQQPVEAKPLIQKVSSKKAVSSITAHADAGGIENLQDINAEADTAEKENNHTKVFIFGAVILTISALFLLLQRFKAQQE